MSRVLILDGSIYPQIYRPSDQFSCLCEPVPCDAVHLPSGEPVPDLSAYSHVIVTGSEASIVEHAPWYDVEAEAVREAVERRLPVLGSCFGHQMLAWALSGPRHVRRSPTPSVGWVEVQVVGNDPLMDAVPRSWNVFAFHFDEVYRPPAPFRILARTDLHPVHVMRYGDLPVWGIQAHPEIPPDQARALMEGFCDLRPDLAGVVRPALRQQVRDHGVARDILLRFLAQRAG